MLKIINCSCKYFLRICIFPFLFFCFLIHPPPQVSIFQNIYPSAEIKLNVKLGQPLLPSNLVECVLIENSFFFVCFEDPDADGSESLAYF